MIPTVFLPIIMALFAMAMVSKNKIAGTFYLLVISLVLGGTAIIQLPMLGGASLLVSHFMLALFVLVGFLMLPPGALADAARTQWLGLVVCAYAALIGFFGPRLFGVGVEVYPMRMDDVGMVPFGPSSSNITHTLYFCGTIILTLVLVAFFRSGSLKFGDLRVAALWLGGIHAAAGIADFTAGTLGFPGLFDFVRNADYAMVEQTINGLKRAAGTFPEPSSYASLSIPVLVFASELWLQKSDRTAGLVAIAVLVATVLSTSSAGFLGIGCYGILLALRVVTSSHRPAIFFRLLGMMAVAGALVILGILLLALNASAFGSLGEAVSLMTMEKAGTDSMDERTVWALQGLSLFLESNGFGVGAGSFRSSSILTACIGSFGIVGAILVPLYFLPLFTPPLGMESRRAEVRISGWSAVMSLVPLLVVGVTPDPGLAFGVFAGYALAGASVRVGSRRGGKVSAAK